MVLKKRINKVILPLSLGVVLVANIITSEIPKQEGFNNINLLIKLAVAETEACGIQETEHGTIPKIGGLCTCEGQWIFPQTCEYVGGPQSCSPIICE
jgi:hypothetical protein